MTAKSATLCTGLARIPSPPWGDPFGRGPRSTCSSSRFWPSSPWSSPPSGCAPGLSWAPGGPPSSPECGGPGWGWGGGWCSPAAVLPGHYFFRGPFYPTIRRPLSQRRRGGGLGFVPEGPGPTARGPSTTRPTPTCIFARRHVTLPTIRWSCGFGLSGAGTYADQIFFSSE